MMNEAGGSRGSAAREDRRAYLLVLLVSVAISLAAVWIFDRSGAHTSVFLLSNFVGPTALTLMHGAGLVVCSEGMGTLGNPICFHAARMPVASAVIALGARLLGDHYLRVGFFKMILLLLPLEMAAWLVCRRLPRERWRRAAAIALLILPFLLTTFLADVVNLQVEEGYSYSLLALALALVLFEGERPPSWRRVVGFCVATAGLYLAKSSMGPAAAVLTGTFLWPHRREGKVVAATLAMVLAAPLGWAMWQHHAAGRFTFGTSIDGANLHKGNDALFLEHYPPAPGETLDMYDPALNRGLHFEDEWSFNDYHQRAAMVFLKTHPRATLEGGWRKLEVVLFSVRKLGSQPQHGALELIEDAGVVVFRMLFWLACCIAMWGFLRRPEPGMRRAAGAFLLVVAAVALPYVVGFAYTRHISVLIYPAVLLCCRSLVDRGREQGPQQGITL